MPVADRHRQQRGEHCGPHVRLADACYLLLSTSLWLANSLLAALGTVLGMAILIAGCSPAIFFAHVDNLARHYLAADLARRAQFDHQALALLGTIVALFLIARLPPFALRMHRALNEGSAL